VILISTLGAGISNLKMSHSSSCEKSRTAAYSNDLRWRIVWQHEGQRRTAAKIAENLCVDKSTVSRILGKFYLTGQVSKKPYPKDKSHRKLTNPAQMLILQLVLDHPGIYLKELQRELLCTLGICVEIAAICKYLRKAKFTRQKIMIRALQQDEFQRQKFISDVSMFSTHMFVFIDESGADNRNRMRRYGYSVRGKPPQTHQMLVRGERVSAITCMSSVGILDSKMVKGTTNGDTFYDFVQTHLLPCLMPYNGTNPHSVVILDNCTVHHVPEVVKSIQDVGALLVFLPPYSPDFNPIEETFSKLKSVLKSLDQNFDMETLLYMSMLEITQDDCMGWIGHTGIYSMNS
jgi:transposase